MARPPYPILQVAPSMSDPLYLVPTDTEPTGDPWNMYYGADPCMLIDFDIDPKNIEDPDEEEDEDSIDWDNEEDSDSEYYADHPDHHWH